MHDNHGLEQLIYIFSKLPGLGTRSARRIILHLLQDKDTRLRCLIDALQDAALKITVCQICNNLDYGIHCSICVDDSRDNGIIAIVETVADLWALERSGVFRGKYHILGSSNSRDPAILNLNQLMSRSKEHGIYELIIATNATLDGQTLAYYITEFFKGEGIKITRLANGIPMGGELDYLDEGTLSTALEKRAEFS